MARCALSPRLPRGLTFGRPALKQVARIRRGAGCSRRRGGRAAEGGGLLNRYTGLNPYRGFESPSLRQQVSEFASSFLVLQTHAPACPKTRVLGDVACGTGEILIPIVVGAVSPSFSGGHSASPAKNTCS